MERETGKPFWKIVQEDDCVEQGISAEESFAQMRGMYQAMQYADAHYDETLKSASGLVGTEGTRMKRAREAGTLLCGDFIGKVMEKALKTSESNACMKRIVAAPTAGSCGVVPAVSLTQVFRQAEQSAIIRAAHAVDRGELPPLENSGSGDLFFLRRRAPDRLVQTVVELCRDRLPKNMGIPAEQIQVLSPTRKGPCGTAALNRALQAALNPPERGKRQKQWGDMTFRVGDRVMQTRNNYDVLWEKEDSSGGSGIFNGDVGVIQDIDPGGELITLRFDDRTAVYTADLLSQLDMAYAVTVHKSQGSEYPAVILAAASAAPSLLVRGVLYTAITRARRLLILAGDDIVLAQMAANNKQQRRYSGLRRRLKEGYHEQ